MSIVSKLRLKNDEVIDVIKVTVISSEGKARKGFVTRVTKGAFFVYSNELAETKYNRKNGNPFDAYSKTCMLFSSISLPDVTRINEFIEERGKLWDGGFYKIMKKNEKKRNVASLELRIQEFEVRRADDLIGMERLSDELSKLIGR